MLETEEETGKERFDFYRWKFAREIVFPLSNIWHKLSLYVQPYYRPGSCNFSNRAENLKEYFRLLKIDNLKNDVPIEPEHHFGVYGDFIKTLCFVHIPLPIERYNVTVRAELLPDGHPFLLGLQAQERMKAKIDTANMRLTLKLGSEIVQITVKKFDKHFVMPLRQISKSYLTNFQDGNIDLRKLHLNTGLLSLENMKTLLVHAGLWKSDYLEPLKSIKKTAKRA